MRTLGFWFVLLMICSLQASQWSVVGDLTHYQVAQPGDTYKTNISVSNFGEEELVITLKQADYVFNSKGEKWFVDPGKLDRSNAQWYTMPSIEYHLKPKTSVDIPLTFRVPDQKQLFGSYWSVLFIEEKTAQRTSGNLTIRQRTGVQLITQIGNTGEIKAEFGENKPDSTKNEMIMTIKNSGDQWIKPAIWLDIFDNNGNKLGRFPGKELKLYPQTGGECRISIESLPQGKYQAVCVVDCGQKKIFANRISFEK